MNKKIRAKNITIANKKARRVVGSDHTVTSVKVLKRTKPRFGRKLYSVTYRKRKAVGKKVTGKVKRLRKYHEKKRGKRAVAVDRSKQARRTFSPKSKKGVKKWKKHPERYDIRGVDTRLKKARVVARNVVQKAKKDIQVAKKQYVEKKKQISKQKVAPKIKKERKAKAKREYKQKAKVVKKEADKKIEKAYEPAKAEVKRHRFKKPWGRERRRRAKYVSRTTGASVLESDALIKRAESKGHDYDTYNWDRIQGKDLSYGERVRKMESGIGKTTTPSQEMYEVMQDEAQFKDEMNTYYRRQDVALHEERIYQRESESGRR